MDKETKYKEIIRANINNTLDSGYVPELGTHKSGKVRDIHFTSLEVGKPIVMVASDRVSSFDFVLNRRIPFKGMVLNQFNQWAFENSEDIIQNASMESPHDNIIVQKYYKNIMVECVVRGYVWGSMAGEYEAGKREMYGAVIPDGLLRYEKLDEPLFTPTTKADDHDAPMTYKEVEDLLGVDMTSKVKMTAIKLFQRASELAEKQGLVFIDTKYEFGIDENNELHLIDEANTPDSSRYCSQNEYKKFDDIKKEMETESYSNVTELLKAKPKLKIKELSKQFVRDVLISKGFSYGSEGEPPSLSDDDVIEVSYRYIDLYEKLTGNEFIFPSGDVMQGMLSGLKKEKYIKGGLAVIMAGSDSDLPHMENIRTELSKYNITSEFRICSAHKQGSACEEIIEKYNQSIEPIIYVTVAGGTDALSGVVSYHSIHPVISCPPDKNNYLSCVQNPPGSSNSLILRPANVAKHVAKILGQHIPEIRKTIIKMNEKKTKTLENADIENKGAK